MSYKEILKKAIIDWFESDLIIPFVLKKGQERLLCYFESDAWYEHINDRKSGITIKSIRHGGQYRRFIAVEGSDKIYEYIKHYTFKSYTKSELLELVEVLSQNFKIMDAEEW